MIEVKEMVETLKRFLQDSQVVMDNGEEIKYVGWVNDKVVISDNIPYRCCDRCGEYVFPEKDGTIDYPYYCPTCDENMYEFETSIVERESYPIYVLRKIWEGIESIPLDGEDRILHSFFIWEAGTYKMAIMEWFDQKCPNGLNKDIINQ